MLVDLFSAASRPNDGVTSTIAKYSDFIGNLMLRMFPTQISIAFNSLKLIRCYDQKKTAVFE